MKAIQLIIKNCEKLPNSIPLVRGAMFDWTGIDVSTPRSVTALGAVLWQNGLAKAPNSWSNLCEILDETPSFLYRWTIGWDVRHVLTITEDKGGFLTEVGIDEVSLEAYRLSKKLIK